MPSMTHPDYDVDTASIFTEMNVAQDTAYATTDVNDCKYLTGSIHRYADYFELYNTVDVLEEALDDDEGPFIVAYRPAQSQ